MVFPPQRYRPPSQPQRFNRNMSPSHGYQKPGIMTQLLNRFTGINTGTGGGLSQTLNNIQQVLNVVESATPLVKQYGPMVKNLPALYRMMKAINEIEDEEGDTTMALEGSENQEQPENPTEIGTEEDKDVEELNLVEPEGKQRYSSKSIPKLYI